MRLEALHFLEGAEIRVLVVQSDHEAHGDQILFKVIHPGPTVGRAVHGPSHCVRNLPRDVFLRLNFPQLFDADSVHLIIHAVTQVEALEKSFGQRASAALGKQRLARMQFHTRREVRPFSAVPATPHVPRSNAFHAAILVIEHLSSREPRVNLHLQRFSLLGQPATHVPQTDDVVAVVVLRRRCRQAERSFFGEEQETVFLRLRIQRRSKFPPVGKQLVQRSRFHDGA